ncbi:MAG: hypothetical protein P8L22_02020 [Acidimicrobiales bacterium]|nr:hypothetical protein [Acidimicrobiales bacterium]
MVIVRKKLHLFTLLLLSIVIFACGASEETSNSEKETGKAVASEATTEEEAESTPEETSSAVEEESSQVEVISFEDRILPIIESSCARCHIGAGPGTTHALLETASDVSANAFAVAAVVEAGVMPPWPASDLSVPFEHDWSLSQQDRDAVIEWTRSGGAVDIDPATKITAAEGVNHLVNYDQEIFPIGNYDGDKGQTDEYRCFIYDPQLTERKFLIGYEFIPDQTEVVHHLVGYRVPQDLREAADQKNFSDGQGGWSCFGGTGLGGNQIGTLNQMITLWGPGTGAVEYQNGHGLIMEPGDFFVMQIHYHYDVEAPADNSSFRANWSTDEAISPVELVQYFSPAEIPCSTTEFGPLCDREASLVDRLASYDGEGVQADTILDLCGYAPEDFAHMTDGYASSICDQSARFSGKVVSVLGHQHGIGTTFRMTLNPGTPEERILLDIPKWDFEWQFNYDPIEEITIKPDDVIRLECTWDRSLRPPDAEPRYVLWADGSDDEMCFGVIMSTRT